MQMLSNSAGGNMTRAPRTSLGLVQLAGLIVVASIVGVWIVLQALDLATPLTQSSGSLSTRLAVMGLDRAVALPLAAIGALACARLAGHGLLGVVYVLGVRHGHPSERLARVLAARSPALVRSIARRAVGAGVGLGIGASAVLGVATTASAAPQPPAADGMSVSQSASEAHSRSVTHSRSHDLTGQSTTGETRPSRVASTIDLGWHETVQTTTPVTRSPKPIAATRVVVRRGDTLWSIAAAHLDAHATDAEITDAWRRWYAANRGLIGGDPDLVLPGTVLTAPSETG
jgi:nucleoid-associated protein YgaU